MLPNTEAPFPSYFDLDGDPLDGGNIYFGLPNQNPVTAPIPVFWDVDGTQPAAQPIRTISGYAVRYGTPTNVFANQSYSISVYDKKGRLVYTEPDSDKYTTVFYKGTGTGAVSRPINSKLGDMFSVKDFGATGDGIVDDTASFQSALTAAAAAGRTLYIPVGTYRVLSKLTASGNVAIVGESRGTSIIYWPGSAANSGIEITLNSVSGFSQVCDVENLSLLTGSTVAAGAALKVIGDTATAADRITSRVVARDLIIRGNTNPTIDGWNIGIQLTNCTNSVIESMEFTGKVGAGEPNYDSVYGILYDNANGASPHPSGLSVLSCFITYAKNGIYADDFEGALVSDCQVLGVNTGVRFGGAANYPHATLMNSHVNASGIAIVIDRMFEVFVQGSLIYAQNSPSAATGIQMINGAGYCSIQDNIFENYNTAQAFNGIIGTSATKSLISGNIFRRCDSINTLVPGIGIWLPVGSSNFMVGANLFDLTTTTVLDSGTLNNVKSSGGTGPWWSTDSDGNTTQWGSTVIVLNAAGDGIITLPKVYRSAHQKLNVSNGDVAFQPQGIFSRNTVTLNQFSFSVRPNPGAVSVRVDWESRGV